MRSTRAMVDYAGGLPQLPVMEPAFTMAFAALSGRPASGLSDDEIR